MCLLFIILLPVIYSVIFIQLCVGFFCFLWFLFCFIIYYGFLKTEYTISCKEVPLNTSHLFKYIIVNIFLFVPKAKAFHLFYNIFFFVYKGKQKINLTNVVVLFFIFFILFWIKYSILFLIGYSFFSLYVTSEFVINYFNALSWNYKNKQAKIQHILINCFLNVSSISIVDDFAIIINGEKIIFNNKNLIDLFLSQVKYPELIQKAYQTDKIIFTKFFINNHFNFSISSNLYSEYSLSKNLTSSSSIKVKNEFNDFFYKTCKDSYKPNLISESKINFLTPSYSFDKKNVLINELGANIFFKMNKFSKNVHSSILNEKNEKIIFYKNGGFLFNVDAPTIQEFCKDKKIPIFQKMEFIDEFEKLNEKYLQTKDGQELYEIFKTVLKVVIN